MANSQREGWLSRDGWVAKSIKGWVAKSARGMGG
jgi:hypothetical protein